MKKISFPENDEDEQNETSSKIGTSEDIASPSNNDRASQFAELAVPSDSLTTPVCTLMEQAVKQWLKLWDRGKVGEDKDNGKEQFNYATEERPKKGEKNGQSK